MTIFHFLFPIMCGLTFVMIGYYISLEVKRRRLLAEFEELDRDLERHRRIHAEASLLLEQLESLRNRWDDEDFVKSDIDRFYNSLNISEN